MCEGFPEISTVPLKHTKLVCNNNKKVVLAPGLQ